MINYKKILCVVLCALSITLISSCRTSNSNTESVDSDVVSTVSTVSVEESTSAEGPSDYLNKRSLEEISAIKGSISTTDTQKLFDQNGDGPVVVFSLLLPDNFTSEPTEESGFYMIYSDEVEIGEIRFNDNRTPEHTKKLTNEKNNLDSNRILSKMNLQCERGSETWEIPVYRISLEQHSNLNSAILYLRQDVLEYEKALEIANSMSFNIKLSISRAGETDYNDKSCKVLILGNSFIYSSNIQQILQNIADSNDKDLVVDAESIGYASVTTFVQNYDIMSRLKSGEYDMVFLCGFYSDYEESFKMLLKEKSEDTFVVVFPAHNESACYYNASVNLHPEAGFADWKGIIDSLMNEGMDPLRLYINDEHHHSTPLAGYAGACLIYSYLYRAIPEESTIDTQIVIEQTMQYGLNEEEVTNDLSDIRQKVYDYLYY